MPITSISILIAIAFNLGIMMIAKNINRFLDKHHIMGALIRITGLFVATIGVQMMLEGIGDYLGAIGIINAMLWCFARQLRTSAVPCIRKNRLLRRSRDVA